MLAQMIIATLFEGIRTALWKNKHNSGSVIRDVITVQPAEDGLVNYAAAKFIAYIVRGLAIILLTKVAIWAGLDPAPIIELLKDIQPVQTPDAVPVGG